MGERRVPTLGARRAPGNRAAVEVLRFDGAHPRVLLGPHLHDDLELMFFATGGGTDRLGEHEFAVSDGDLLLITPGIVHNASGLGAARGWAVEFSVDAVALAQPAAPPPGDAVPQLWWSNPLLTPFVAAGQRPAFARFQVPEPDRAAWSARLAAMETEQAQRREGYQEVIGAYLLITLVELARLAAPVPVGLRQQGEVLLARVFDVIEQRYPEPLSTADVAAAVGLSPGYLTTLVRRRTGRTVLDWILERRMAQARALLLDTDLSAETIAGRVGYADPAYFNRRFRAVHRQAPGAWRASALDRR